MTLADHLAKAREHTRRAAELRGTDLDEVQREFLRAVDALARAQALLARGLPAPRQGMEP